MDERFAQAAIQLKRPVPVNLGGMGEPGVVNPAALLDGYSYTTPSPIGAFNADELAVISLKDNGDNSIDVFYVDSITQGDRATAYGESRNNTGNAEGDNFIIVASNKKPLTLPHECMHILLNSPHRTGEPSTALFDSPTSTTKKVDGTKRIGPYNDAMPPGGVGHNDTITIRAVAEDLP